MKMEKVQLLVTGPNKVIMERIFIEDEIPAGHVRVRTKYSLISPGTELAIFTHTHVGFNDPANTYVKYPFHPGYAAVGIIEHTAPDISGFSHGDIVYFRGCHENIAILRPQDCTMIKIPDGLECKLAPFARLLQISYTGINVLSPPQGKSSVVIGLGLIGNLTAQLLQWAGVNVTAVEPLESRCEWARACGIRDVINPGKTDFVSIIQEKTADSGVDIVIEATGVPEIFVSALKIARCRGEVVQLGSPRGSVLVDTYNLIHRNLITIYGAHESLIPVDGGDGQLDQSEVARRMLELLANGTIHVDSLISLISSPEDIKECYNRLQNNKDQVIGILLDWEKITD